MDVVVRVAAFAALVLDRRVDRDGVAGAALQVRVRTHELELRRLLVVEARARPFVRDVAALALLATGAAVSIVEAVARLAVHWKVDLLRWLDVAALAGGSFVPATEREIRLGMIESALGSALRVVTR